VEINDLYDESPLEDRLWAELKRHKIPAERQEFVTIKDQNYSLDFAIYCAKANIDVETDGDSYHANPEKSNLDNRRNNELAAAGWDILRFTTSQIMEETESYCISKIINIINKQGGVIEGTDQLVPRKINHDVEGAVQLGLFDDW
jgi:very-short-patch-repair endonuclease